MALIDENCPACGKRFYFRRDQERHVCDPIFWILAPDDDSPYLARGTDAESALETWVPQYDTDCEHPILCGEEMAFRVIPDDEYQDLIAASEVVDWEGMEVGEKYIVSGEWVPEYYVTSAA